MVWFGNDLRFKNDVNMKLICDFMEYVKVFCGVKLEFGFYF